MVFGYGGYDDGGGSDSKNRGLHGWWRGLFPCFACDGQLECLGQGMLMKEDISSCTSDILTWQALISLILNMFSASFSQKAGSS